ncbi:helix-turn-helix domain-containing protein [Umezawaea beigongshangensis]|uniref:helix-turn-helix domain-containing protein n=1 Tax=Umezawaea beigongshangensis TaxID=2780383 RepID=UPI0018F1EFD8|nr:helix-turn-helix transcriptional regulator [Umezawaea beigongshangensis]
MGTYKPNVRERLVARCLASWRWETGKSGAEVSREVGFSQAKLSKLENAYHPIRPEDVKALGEVYRVPEPDRDLLYRAAERALVPGWWEDETADALFEAVREYVELESEASLVRAYKSDVLPGLVQTRAYALALGRAWLPPQPEEVVEAQARVRLKRQERLDDVDHPLEARFVVAEGTLRQEVGGPAVMVEQLHHLLALAGRENVTVQVVPFSCGAHAAQGSSFSVLSFADKRFEDVVYLENLNSGRYVETRYGREPYVVNFNALQEAALDADASVKHIVEVADELRV